MKKILTILMMIVLVSVTAFVVSAEYTGSAPTLTFDIYEADPEYDAVGNGYDVILSVSYPEPECVSTIMFEFDYNPEKLVVADSNDYKVMGSLGTSTAPIFTIEHGSGRNKYAYEIAGCTWTGTTHGKVSLFMSDATPFNGDLAEGAELCLVAFQFPEGVTVEDLDYDDFVITKAYVADSKETGMIEFGYKYNEEGVYDLIEVVNNVVPEAPAAPEAPAGAAVESTDAVEATNAFTFSTTFTPATEEAVTAGFIATADDVAGFNPTNPALSTKTVELTVADITKEVAVKVVGYEDASSGAKIYVIPYIKYANGAIIYGAAVTYTVA